MDNQLKKLTAEIKAKFLEALGKKDMQDAIAETKAAENSGTFEVVVSTADRDRQGDIIMQDGWVLDNYLKNPVVLFGHDYWSLPIGVTDEIKVIDGKLVAKGRFAKHEFAQNVRELYDAGMLPATSVGFIPLEQEGNVIMKAELLEFSFVPVPANPMALSLAHEKQLNLEYAFAKGIMVKEDVPAEPAATEPAATEETTETTEPTTTEEPAAEGTNTDTTPPAAADNDGEQAGGEANNETSPQPEAVEPEGSGEGAGDTEPEQKGAVQDRINAQAEQTYATVEEKYTKMDAVLEIVYAFCGVYGQPETKPEQFKELLLETVGLLTDLANGTDNTDAVKGVIAKAIADGVQKSGRVLSAKNRTLLETTLAKIKDSGAAIEDLLKQADAEGSDGESEGKSAEPEIEKPQGYAEVKSALQLHIETREVLRMAATAVTSALEKQNTKIRELSGGK